MSWWRTNLVTLYNIYDNVWNYRSILIYVNNLFLLFVEYLGTNVNKMLQLTPKKQKILLTQITMAIAPSNCILKMIRM